MAMKKLIYMGLGRSNHVLGVHIYRDNFMRFHKFTQSIDIYFIEKYFVLISHGD